MTIRHFQLVQVIVQEESAILQNKQSLVAIDEALELPDSCVYHN